MSLSQISIDEQTTVSDAYHALFELIQSFPKPLAQAWWSGAWRTLESNDPARRLAAIKLYGENAQKAHERYQNRVQS